MSPPGALCVLARSMGDPGGLTPLAGQRIGDADPDQKPPQFGSLHLAAGMHGFEHAGEDRADNLDKGTRKCIGVHHSPTNATP